MKIKSIQDPQGEFVEVGEKEQLAAEAVTVLEFIRACRVADVVQQQKAYQVGRDALARKARGQTVTPHDEAAIAYAQSIDQWVGTSPLARNAGCSTPLQWFAHQQHRQPLSFGMPSFRLHYEPWESATKPGRVRLVKPSENPGGGELIYEWEFSVAGYPAGGGRRAGGLLDYDQASLALEWKPTTMTPSRGAPPLELPGKSGPDPEDLALCLKELMERPGLLYSGGPNGQPQGVVRVQQEIQKRLHGLLTRPASPVRGKIREEALQAHLGVMRARVSDFQRANNELIRVNRLLSDLAGRYIAQQTARVGGAVRSLLFWTMLAGAASVGGKMLGDYLLESTGLKEEVHQRMTEEKMYALPPDISDMGTVFWSARHLEDRNRFYYDNVLDTTAFSKAFLGGKLKLMEVKTVQEGGEMKRVYHLSIPSKETGETLPGLNGSHEQNVDAMKTVTWADALNLATNARNMTDAAVTEFIANWYKKTYRDQRGLPVNLDTTHLVIQRAKDRSVTAVLYSGANAGSLLRFARVDFNGDIAPTSRQSNRRLEVVPKPLTANGRLLLWTGANQDLTVPEEHLPHAWAVRWDLKRFGDLNFTSAELAASLRRYYDRRNAVGVGDRYNEIDFVDATDPVVQRLVAQVLQGKRSDWEKLEQLRTFSQQIEYKSEAGIDVNRPPVATLLQGWGDCNNRSVFMASLFKAAGFRTALIWLDNDAKALPEIGKKRPADYFAGHVMLGIHADHFKGGPRRFDTWFYDGLKGKEEWVLAETGAGMPFGVQPISGMVITRIEEVR